MARPGLPVDLPTQRKAQPYHANRLMSYLYTFLEWCGMKGYSEATVTTRLHAIEYFIAWCDERNIDDPKVITRPMLERYRRALYYHRKADGQPLGMRTQQQRIISLRMFFKWLTKENYILSNPASELEAPKAGRRLPKAILTHSEVEQVIAQTALNESTGLRDRAIIETLYSTGIRRMELINLKLYDLDMETGAVWIREGKGKKDRVIPIGQRACEAISAYVDHIRPHLVVSDPDDGTLFLTDYGQPFARNRMGDLVRKYLDLAGIKKPGSCHLFRHTMATLMLENGCDVRYLQAMLGHSSLSTTEIYTQVSIRKLRDIHAATHPAKRRDDIKVTDANSRK